MLLVSAGRRVFRSHVRAGKGTLKAQQPVWGLAQSSANQPFVFDLWNCTKHIESLGTSCYQSFEVPCELGMAFCLVIQLHLHLVSL